MQSPRLGLDLDTETAGTGSETAAATVVAYDIVNATVILSLATTAAVTLPIDVCRYTAVEPPSQTSQ